MRCPTCNATNPDGAAFCGLCLRRFADVVPASAVAPGSSPAGPARAEVGRFTAEDGELRWTCAVCGTQHPLGVFTCRTCGARIDVETPDPHAAPVDLDRARRLEAVVPGLGHLRTGHTGMGGARAGITAIWLAGSLLLAGGGISGLLTALPLVVGLAVIWVTGPGDVRAARLGRSPRLDARRFMYLVLGATTCVILAGGLILLR